MKGSLLAGILLLVLGVLALAYQGITYTQHKKVLDIGPLQATKKSEKNIPLPPILGAAAVVGGVVLVYAGGRRS
jgi:hypothetical protein